MLMGCDRKHTQNSVHFYGALNSSVSARPQLSGFATQLGQVVAQLEPDHDHVTLFRVDDTTSEIADGSASLTPDHLQQTLITTLKPLSAHDDTLTEHLWTALAKQVAHEGRPTIICFWTDGYSEGTSAAGHKQIAETAAKLALNPHVKGVVLIGLKPATRAEVRTDLAALEQKLGPTRFLLLDGTAEDLNQITTLIDSARE